MKSHAYFPQIDSLRAIAVFMVLISHWLPPSWLDRLQLGKLGVELFFVISGFLITRILFRLRDTPPARNPYLVFYARRFLRIFPIYYFVLLITFCFGSTVVRDAIFWNLGFLSNFYILWIDAWPGPVSHLWTLAVEEQFYLVWPLLILQFSRKYTLPMIWGVILLACLSRYYFYWADYNLYYPYIFTLSCFDNLAAGALLAFYYCYGSPETLRRWVHQPLLWGIAIVFLGITLFTYGDTDYGPLGQVFLRSSTSLLFFLLLGKFLFYTPKPSTRWLTHPWLLQFGKMSYAAYLWHNFIPGFYLGLEKSTHPYLLFLLYFLSLLPIAYLSWRWIEVPFNRWKDRFSYAPSVSDLPK